MWINRFFTKNIYIRGGDIGMKKIEPLDLMKVEYRHSVNQSNNKVENKFIILHHTGPKSFDGAVKWLTNPQAKASAHYAISSSGEIVQMVNTKKSAWHAGISHWGGLKNLNKYSIGIELFNYGLLEEDGGKFYYEYGREVREYEGSEKPVFGKIVYPSGTVLCGYYVPYPDKQIDRLVALIKGLVEKYPRIGKDDILTHYQVGLPEARKKDPFGLDIGKIIKRVFDE